MQPIHSVAIVFCLLTQSFSQDAEIYEWNVAIPGSPAVPADLATDPSSQVVVTGYVDSSINNQSLVVA